MAVSEVAKPQREFCLKAALETAACPSGSATVLAKMRNQGTEARPQTSDVDAPPYHADRYADRVVVGHTIANHAARGSESGSANPEREAHLVGAEGQARATSLHFGARGAGPDLAF